jgi:hypothetical protein
MTLGYFFSKLGHSLFSTPAVSVKVSLTKSKIENNIINQLMARFTALISFKLPPFACTEGT